VTAIHSEWNDRITSQAYSLGEGVFECPSWIQILVRDTEDALTIFRKENRRNQCN
jgi:hypothetical protein